MHANEPFLPSFLPSRTTSASVPSALCEFTNYTVVLLLLLVSSSARTRGETNSIKFVNLSFTYQSWQISQMPAAGLPFMNRQAKIDTWLISRFTQFPHFANLPSSKSSRTLRPPSGQAKKTQMCLRQRAAGRAKREPEGTLTFYLDHRYNLCAAHIGYHDDVGYRVSYMHGYTGARK